MKKVLRRSSLEVTRLLKAHKSPVEYLIDIHPTNSRRQKRPSMNSPLLEFDMSLRYLGGGRAGVTRGERGFARIGLLKAVRGIA